MYVFGRSIFNYGECQFNLIIFLGISFLTLKLLVRRIAVRTEFTIRYSVDRLYIRDEQSYLMFFRLFQELLNNALQHSRKEKVESYLHEIEDGFRYDWEQIESSFLGMISILLVDDNPMILEGAKNLFKAVVDLSFETEQDLAPWSSYT